MKIILSVLIFISATLISFGQDTIYSKHTETDSTSRLITELKKRGLEHFAFKNIPIDGSLNKFVAQLKKQSFIVVKTTNLDAILTGKFTGYDVHLLVQATPKAVYGVTVSYAKKSSWKAIKGLYENMKSMLSVKYGDPKETIEKFDSPYYENSGLELYALSEDKCTYMSLFTTKTGNGMIKSWISTDASLVINYVDTLNYLLVNGKAYNDL